MLSKYFIERPIFAGVLAIMLMALGIFSILNLPVERYPDIAPPRIVVSTTYSGADATTVEESVTQILEQQMKGLDHLLYFSSSSDSNGRSRINLSFENGTNPDTAQVQVQNALNSVLTRLPADVQRQGINVYKSLGDTHMVIGLFDQTKRSNNIELSDYLLTYLESEIARIDGVGEVDVFGAQFAMRIWLDANKLKEYKLMPSDIQKAVEAQNTQVAAGGIGQLPVATTQYLNAKVTAGTRLRSVDDFNKIIVKSAQDGSYVYLKDVARVEIGAENYQGYNTINGYPSAAMAISLASGANAVETTQRIQEKINHISRLLPKGYQLVYPRDNTPFIQESLKEVVKTLIEAIVLVVIVIFIFLQNWRATLIPTLTVPVVILGTMAVLFGLGMSINTLTLFALVLAIGLLVDDAIVVVENVERLMHEHALDAKQASIVSMQEISGALVGITLVLTAVFVPMAFFGGSTGVIYRQFSITLITAMSISLLVALVLTPALCGLILKPNIQPYRWATWFNQQLDKMKQAYLKLFHLSIQHRLITVVIALALVVVFSLFYRILPTSFLPSEDQGSLGIQITLQENAPMSKTIEVGEDVRRYFLQHEKNNVELVMLRYGNNRSGTGQNLAQGFIKLKHWDDRPGKKNSADAIRTRAMQYLAHHANAQISMTMPPVVNGLGDTNGINLWLRDIDGQGRQHLAEQFNLMQQQAKNYTSFEKLEKKSAPEKANLHVDIDQKAALAAGVAISDINSTLSAALGGKYINDYIDRGRIKKVIMQSDAIFRSQPTDLQFWHVRNSANEMVPFSNFSQVSWSGGPEVVNRFNGYTAIELEAMKAENASSGQAMKELEQLVNQQTGVDLAWSGLSFEENKSSQQAIWLYLISIAFIFLCLAALYESWSIPTAVMAAIPLGIGGNILFSYFAGFPNDIYFQIALLTTIGLSCKNAILIVEFAALSQQQGHTAIEAALQAASLRLRPILMTSLAFGAGIIPLVFAFGAGAASRQEIGISVLGGVIFGTLLVLVFIPFMYVAIRQFFKQKS
ncbi:MULTISPECIES: multidrug efflux RND transporter permease subunit [unclassified Acinetobacter]|uniref:multidrug efflux RND transporter permease subunit n=1 Tax=unclassified Acinetobacter TaxID=196816 RepID=UPI00293519A1|nr:MULTISPECIES: multidrug efflux RND transporter permease subunit [unclassified Acinetobacter]WOE31478.1 multidrug efflux RND transporter permease subunit [Acinetobacter sp. SAAs470]WOE39674.1 multidrug efflux RND transporter permease subunit [Acinetobacter sp. SAAs474]